MSGYGGIASSLKVLKARCVFQGVSWPLSDESGWLVRVGDRSRLDGEGGWTVQDV